MPDIKPEQLLLFAGFVLPGTISMYVYGLIVQQKGFELKDRIAEAVSFSLLNFMLVWIPIDAAVRAPEIAARWWATWMILVAGFLIAPVLWPFVLVMLIRGAERVRLIAVQTKTGWDDFFTRQRMGCWLQVELNDGRVVGGRFGRRSFASAYPDPGHLLIEELWKVDGDGYFSEPWPGKAGLILRPSDYKFVRVYAGEGS